MELCPKADDHVDRPGLRTMRAELSGWQALNAWCTANEPILYDAEGRPAYRRFYIHIPTTRES